MERGGSRGRERSGSRLVGTGAARKGIASPVPKPVGRGLDRGRGEGCDQCLLFFFIFYFYLVMVLIKLCNSCSFLSFSVTISLILGFVAVMSSSCEGILGFRVEYLLG